MEKKNNFDAKEYVNGLIKIVKEADIDDKYLSDKGIDFGGKKFTQCPIHNGEDKNFKFMETEDNGRIYTCFSHGCIKGDIVDLCISLESSVSSPLEAVKFLADKYGVELPIKKKFVEYTPEQKKEYAIKLKRNKFLQSDEYIAIKELYLQELYTLRDIKIADENTPIEQIDPINRLIKAIEKNTVEVPAKDFKRLQLLYDYKRHENKSNCKVFEIDKKLSDFQELIEAIFMQKGLFEINCFTGGGKTFATLEAFKNLSKKYDDYVFVIACPNKVQNEQNGIKPGVFTLVAGVNVQQHNRVVSSVYEKIDEIIDVFHDKKIVLVIDEAHQLLSSIGYRLEGIEKLEAASAKCRTVIHLTATDRKLLEFKNYQYDGIYKFVPNSSNNLNIENFNLIKCKSVTATMLRLAKTNKANSKKSLIFVSGEKSDLEEYKQQLEKKNFKVGVVTSDHKGEDIFTSIAEKSKIPEEYDVVLTSSVLDCGTNIENEEEIVAIDVVTNSNYFDLDTSEQRFARIRTKQKQAILLIPDKEQVPTEEIKSLDKLKEEWNFKLDRTLNDIKAIEETLIKLNHSPEDIESSLKTFVSTNNVLYGYGIIEFIEGVPVVNEKKLINRIFQEYDKQLLGNTDLLMEVLKTKIKAKNFTEGTETNQPEDHEQVEQMKQDKKTAKEIKKERAAEARTLILKAKNNSYLRECLTDYLLSDNKAETLQAFYDSGEEQVYRDLKFLDGEEKELKKLKTLLNIEELKEDADKLLYVYEKYEKQAHVDKVVKSYSYAKANTLLQDDEMKLKFNTVYGTIRNTLDPLLVKRSRITEEKIDELIAKLNENKCMHRILDSVDNKFFKETYGTNSFRAMKDKVVKAIFKEVELIYKLSKSKEYYKISSLIKKIDL